MAHRGQIRRNAQCIESVKISHHIYVYTLYINNNNNNNVFLLVSKRVNILEMVMMRNAHFANNLPYHIVINIVFITN